MQYLHQKQIKYGLSIGISMFLLAVLHNPSGNTSLKFRYTHFDEKPGDFWFIQQAVNPHVPIPNAGKYLTKHP
ncbi:MAG: hypothetical protein RMX68_010635 [Aulosira sp. ZfuVER01]|nr:hypothetical protein [Aulosira sp. ZfuVER01]MDZ7999858.1 hypothetical protein [Aulosira sp. DedVER01a]MDZ8053797.1 hypothetical protein [Aulosira sp. ZfuCHP01]